MSFTSFQFIGFFVLMLVPYYFMPKKLQWVWLLVGSYVFYLWSVPEFAFFLLFSTVTTYLFPLQIGKINTKQTEWLKKNGEGLTREEKKSYKQAGDRNKKLLVFLCLLCNLGFLALVKYMGTLVGIFNSVGANISIDWLIFPLGISFYTFQSVGYAIDVYRGAEEPQKNFFKYALYVSFFPQICQGPIGRYSSLAPQLYKPHKFDYDGFVYGLQRMLLGFFKKLVIANRITIVVDYFYGSVGKYSGVALAFATFMYAIQLYADFSGYMDIAIGAGKCFGIKLDKNFEQPYFSRSIAEFWRRWHITLGSWFRDYLYYPVLRSSWCSKLGKNISKSGNKKLAQMITTALALSITWLAIGVWHGSKLTFLFYGIYHGLFIVLDIVLSDKYAKAKKRFNICEEMRLWKAFQTLRTFFIVCVGYVLFRSDSITDAITPFGNFVIKPVISSSSLFLELKEGVFALPPIQYIILFAALLPILLMEIYSFRKGDFTSWFAKRPTFFRWGCLYITFLATIFIGTTGSVGASSFLYFKF